MRNNFEKILTIS